MPPGGARAGAGRPRGVVSQASIDVKEAALEHASAAIDIIASIMKDTSEPGSVRIVAANSILDRAYGKPKQSVDVESTMTVMQVREIARVIVSIDNPDAPSLPALTSEQGEV